MPASELVLVLNDDFNGHRLNPTTPTQDPPVPLLSSGTRTLPLPLLVPETWTPRVLKQLLSNEADLYQQWEWSDDQ